jgi:hypothetical protein
MGLGNEAMAIDARHGVENALVTNPSTDQLLFDHARPARGHDRVDVLAAAVAVHGGWISGRA